MPLPDMSSSMRRIATILLAGAMCVASRAQENAPPAPMPAPQASSATSAPASRQFYLGQDYSKPTSHFPNPIAPYMPRHVPAPNLSNTARIDGLMQDGKIMLSIDDAVALALENNLDIAIARYNLNIADTDLLRAKSGNSILGVPSGLVQNTPGGGVGGFGSAVGARHRRNQRGTGRHRDWNERLGTIHIRYRQPHHEL